MGSRDGQGSGVDRREFLKVGAAAGLALTGLARATGAGDDPIRVGVVGTGGRGRALLGILLSMKAVEVPAICDIDPKALAAATEMVERSGRAKPAGYGDGDEAFKKLMDRSDLHALVVATPWRWHTEMAVYGMKAGKYVGVEVPAALSLEECWSLVDTQEKTKVPCMMLENWSFRRDNLAVLNMIRAGLLGEIVHCHCAHSHDCIDHWFFDPQGNDRWGAEYLIKHNRSQYPTHALGPVLSWLDINCGDNFDTLTATATDSRAINAYFARTFGPDHPGAKRRYAQGDIVTCIIRTCKGKSIVVNYDMQLPRPYDNRWEVEGTLGIYNEQRNSVYLTGKSPGYHEWEPFAPYQEKHDHAWWLALKGQAGGLSHGGTDHVELLGFIDAARRKGPTPLDIYDSAVMSSVVALSEDSIAKGGSPVKCPDFTRGRWKTRKPYFALDAG